MLPDLELEGAGDSVRSAAHSFALVVYRWAMTSEVLVVAKGLMFVVSKVDVAVIVPVWDGTGVSRGQVMPEMS